MMSDLSNDLVEEILSRVPATTLMQLQYTCKQWNALLNDRKFSQKHLSKASKQNTVVMLKDFRVYSMDVNLHEIRKNMVDPAIMVSGKLCLTDSPCDSEVDISKIYHCNGLLLCTITDNNRLVVCNPCTGQTKWIEQLQRPEYNHKCKNLYGIHFESYPYDGYFLGYENSASSPNYKIVRVLFCLHVFNVEIYEFNTDSWRVLESTPDWFICSYGVPLKGNTYWCGEKKIPQFKPVLISFDFTTERFECLCLPVRDSMVQMDLSSVREEQLTVLYLTFFDPTCWDQIEIWVTNEIRPNFVSWSNTFRVGTTMGLRGTCTIRYQSHMNFLIDEEKKVVLFCAEKETEGYSTNMVFINGEDGVIRQEDLRESRCPIMLISYVPSLIQI